MVFGNLINNDFLFVVRDLEDDELGLSTTETELVVGVYAVGVYRDTGIKALIIINGGDCGGAGTKSQMRTQIS